MDKERFIKNINETEPSGGRIKLLLEAVSFLMVSCVFMGLIFWSYRKWPDLLVDFGQQLYIPWRLTQGERLYADIAFFHGPFSQYFNAFWFHLFGPSLSILICINLMILAYFCFVVYKTLCLVADTVTATACLILFLVVFAFAQYVGIGNYNWVTPYTHGATHGMTLLATFIYLWSVPRTHHPKRNIIAGALCLGLAVMTKVDIALAAVAVGLTAVVVALLSREKTREFSITDAAVFLIFFTAPSVCFFLYSLTYLPLSKSLATVASCLPLVLVSDVSKNFFYVQAMGLNNPGYNINMMFQAALLISGLIACAVFMDILAHKYLKHPFSAGIPFAVMAFALLMWQRDFISWEDIPRALPIFVIAALGVMIFFFFRRSADPDGPKKIVPALLWAVAAVVLLIKIFFNVKFSAFGFYAAVPAALIFAAVLLYGIPRLLESKFQSGQVFRLLALVFLTALAVNYFKISHHFYQMKIYPIGRDQDMFYTYRPDRVFPIGVTERALRWIETNMPPQATFAALPEGIMLNYLTRRTTSVPTINFVMTELMIFGEEHILEEFKFRPPDYILLVHKESFEFGVGPFGVDHRNGYKIMQWIHQNYSVEKLIGAEPFRNEIFGIKIMKSNMPSGTNHR